MSSGLLRARCAASHLHLGVKGRPIAFRSKEDPRWTFNDDDAASRSLRRSARDYAMNKHASATFLLANTISTYVQGTVGLWRPNSTLGARSKSVFRLRHFSTTSSSLDQTDTLAPRVSKPLESPLSPTLSSSDISDPSTLPQIQSELFTSHDPLAAHIASHPSSQIYEPVPRQSPTHSLFADRYAQLLMQIDTQRYTEARESLNKLFALDPHEAVRGPWHNPRLHHAMIWGAGVEKGKWRDAWGWYLLSTGRGTTIFPDLGDVEVQSTGNDATVEGNTANLALNVWIGKRNKYFALPVPLSDLEAVSHGAFTLAAVFRTLARAWSHVDESIALEEEKDAERGEIRRTMEILISDAKLLFADPEHDNNDDGLQFSELWTQIAHFWCDSPSHAHLSAHPELLSFYQPSSTLTSLSTSAAERKKDIRQATESDWEALRTLGAEIGVEIAGWDDANAATDLAPPPDSLEVAESVGNAVESFDPTSGDVSLIPWF